MKTVLLTVLILAVLIQSPKSTVIHVDPWSCIDDATLIVVGRMVDVVPDRFRIVCNDLPKDTADESLPGVFEYAYNSGVIEVERVLKGEWPDSRILVAYKAWSKINGGPIRPYKDYGVANDERHIWTLRKSSAFLRIYALEPGRDVIPVDSLRMVQERIVEGSTK